MPKKAFRDSKTVARFLQLLETYMGHPYEELAAGYSRFLNQADNWLSRTLYINHAQGFNHQLETQHLINVCAYEGAMILNAPDSKVDIEAVVSFFLAEYADLKLRRNTSPKECVLSDEGLQALEESVVQKKIDRDAISRAKRKETKPLSIAITYSIEAYRFASADKWIDYEFLGDEYLEAIDSLEPGELEVFILKTEHPNMKQKDMAKLLGLTDGGVTRRMDRVKAKFSQLEKRARRPKKKAKKR